MSRASRIAVRGAGAGLVIRLVFAGALALLSSASGEASILVILDFPTLGVYWLLQQLGITLGIRDAFDVRFFMIGLGTWAVLGYLFGYIATVLLEIRQHDGRPGDTPSRPAPDGHDDPHATGTTTAHTRTTR